MRSGNTKMHNILKKNIRASTTLSTNNYES